MWITVNEDGPGYATVRCYDKPPKHLTVLPDGRISDIGTDSSFMDNPDVDPYDELARLAGCEDGFCRRVEVLRAPLPHELLAGVMLLHRSTSGQYALVQVMGVVHDEVHVVSFPFLAGTQGIGLLELCEQSLLLGQT